MTERRNTNGKKAKWQGFINVYLSKEDKKQIKSNLLSDRDIIEFIVRAAELDYKFSVTQSADGKTYTVTLYGMLTTNVNGGYALSARHADLVTAITAVNYIMADGGLEESWEERHGAVGNDDW